MDRLGDFFSLWKNFYKGIGKYGNYQGVKRAKKQWNFIMRQGNFNKKQKDLGSIPPPVRSFWGLNWGLFTKTTFN